MTSWHEVSALSDRELDARIALARQLEHPALADLLRERIRRSKVRLTPQMEAVLMRDWSGGYGSWDDRNYR